MFLGYSLLPILTFVERIIPTINPNKPMAEAKISMMRILTKRVGFAASVKAAPDPTIPTATPQNKLDNPTMSPDPNTIYPLK